MMIVLDTNVAAELMRATPAPIVLAWLQQTSSSGLCTTSVTFAEIR
jgi:toxin FitB